MKFILQHGSHVGPELDANGQVVLDANKRPLRKIYKAGDTVELTPDQAISFGDKFKSEELVRAEEKVLIAKNDEIRRLEAEKAELERQLREAHAAQMGQVAPGDIEAAKNPPAVAPTQVGSVTTPSNTPAPAPSPNPQAPQKPVTQSTK